jgi:REP element-mobilizing transposase RayT
MNHVHLVISLDPQYGVHRAVKRFKGATLSGAEKSVESQPEKTVTRENSI